MKVLIADDDDSVRESLRKVLEEADYEVLLAADGQEALKHFEDKDIDLLLLDIDMPIKNGWETFEHIVRRNPVMPIIAITREADQYKSKATTRIGTLMEKPLDVFLLLQTLRELLAAPKEERLRPVCGDINVPYSSALFLHELREHCSISAYGALSKSLQSL